MKGEGGRVSKVEWKQGRNFFVYFSGVKREVQGLEEEGEARERMTWWRTPLSPFTPTSEVEE